jgi:penicillin-binding protein 1A
MTTHLTDSSDTASDSAPDTVSPVRRKLNLPLRILIGLLTTTLGLILVAILTLCFALALAYPNLPELDSLTDYRPKIPLRIFSSSANLAKSDVIWLTSKIFPIS